MQRINAKIRGNSALKGNLDIERSISGKIAFREVQGNTYKGKYNFIPSKKQQIIETKNKILLDNITIEPIPKNYGLITKKGSILIIS